MSGGSIFYIQISGLPSDVKKKLEIPIDHWLKSKTNQSYVEKLINLGITLESFYEASSARLGLRASRFLGDGIEERKKLKINFKDIYGARSKSVHRGEVPQNARELIEKGQELFERSLRKVIEDCQFPDWEEIELG